MDPSKRTFERINHVMYERFPLTMVLIAHGPITSCVGSFYRMGRKMVLLELHNPILEFESNWESDIKKSCTQTSDALDKILYDEGHRNLVYLVISRVSSQVNSTLTQRIQSV